MSVGRSSFARTMIVSGEEAKLVLAYRRAKLVSIGRARAALSSLRVLTGEMKSPKYIDAISIGEINSPKMNSHIELEGSDSRVATHVSIRILDTEIALGGYIVSVCWALADGQRHWAYVEVDPAADPIWWPLSGDWPQDDVSIQQILSAAEQRYREQVEEERLWRAF